jgi:hypothetical protein
MNNEAALSAVTDQRNILSYQITIPEGYRAVQIFNELSRITSIPVEEFWSAAEDLASFGIPEEAPTIEGYLFPDTYSFDLKATAPEMLAVMVRRMEKALSDAGVARQDWHRVLTLASITQREAKQEPDFYKVARVFANRISVNMPLETDPTISYSYDGADMSEATREEQIAYGYNTYLVGGLPPGPISSPGELAIDATLNPVEGEWLFFVTINLATGETKFSKTLVLGAIQGQKGWYRPKSTGMSMRMTLIFFQKPTTQCFSHKSTKNMKKLSGMSFICKNEALITEFGGGSFLGNFDFFGIFSSRASSLISPSCHSYSGCVFCTKLTSFIAEYFDFIFDNVRLACGLSIHKSGPLSPDTRR